MELGLTYVSSLANSGQSLDSEQNLETKKLQGGWNYAADFIFEKTAA